MQFSNNFVEDIQTETKKTHSIERFPQFCHYFRWNIVAKTHFKMFKMSEKNREVWNLLFKVRIKSQFVTEQIVHTVSFMFLVLVLFSRFPQTVSRSSFRLSIIHSCLHFS